MHNHDTPSQWFVRHAEFITPNAAVLDVACGYGRHAKFFALRGAKVTAVDRDAHALATLRDIANVTTNVCDLENDPWPYAAQSFDAVIACNYLWRPTFDALLVTIKIGGVLIYETFMDGNERFGKPTRPDFLLRSNELLVRAREAFRVVGFEEGEEISEGTIVAVKQKICAIRMH